MSDGNAAGPPQANRRRIAAALAVVLVLSFGLRLWLASANLHGGGHYDERYSLRNVTHFLVKGKLRPQNAYYPSVSWLPHTAVLAASEGLHRLSGIEALSIYDERRGDGYSSTAYLLCRLVSALAGTLSIALIFFLGRRLFSPAVGLLAAALLSAVWGHVQLSAVFKPDILVVFLTLVTFWWGLDAIERPSLQRYLVAGLGVGLVTAAKYNGVGAAIPLTVATLYGGWRQRHRWRQWHQGLWLVLAGVASVVTFVALNPWLPLIFKYAGRVQDIYESKGALEGGTHAEMLVAQGQFLWRHHGVVIFGFALAGLVGLVVRWLRTDDRNQRLEALQVLAYVLGYSAFYAASTTLFRSQNYLPVAAFSALLAAWAMVAGWRRLGARLGHSRWRLLASPLLAAAAVAVLLVTAFRFPVTATYRHVVPTTAELAARFLVSQLRPVELRQIYFESQEPPIRPFRGGHYLASVPVERLDELDLGELERVDGEVFPASRLDAPEGDFYFRRLAERVGPVLRFPPDFLAAHGQELVVYVHAWSLRDKPLPLVFEAGAGFRTSLDGGEDEVVSLALWLPYRRGGQRSFVLEVDGQPMRPYMTRTTGHRAHYLTPRFAPRPGCEVVVRYRGKLKNPQPPEGELLRWSAPAP